MIEIRFHGRGGMGAVTSSEIVAEAAFKDGKHSQAFPAFSVARRGAPVKAFSRIDDKFIKLRTHVYQPDYLVVLDKTLLGVENITEGLKKDGIIIINSEKKEKIGNHKTYNVDATKISLENLGKPIVNTAVLGAFAKISKIITLKSLKEAVSEKFPKPLADKNIKAIEMAYNEVE